MPTANRRLTYILVAITLLAAGVGAILWRGSENAPSEPGLNSGRRFCGPDSQLTDTQPTQSHRSYCVRAYSPVEGLKPGEPITFPFDIVDDRGSTLLKFATVHEKLMHVIVVRKDLAEFQHVHPVFSATDGRFTVRDLVFPNAGPYRLFADFTPAGEILGPDSQPLAVTIPIDLEVGDQRSYRAQPLQEPSDTARTGDLEVTLSRPDTLRAGEEVRLVFTIRQGGSPVSGLEPYLGANGHAVVLRDGDLAFLHSHALEDPSALKAGQLPFMVHLAEPGRYRIFVQFQHRGTVQTAEFTLPTVIGGRSSPSSGGHTGH